jgi:hypothetical protein
MQFFLYEIVARIVAIYLCVDCIRTVRYGLAERKIAYFNTDPVNWFLDSFLDPSNRVAHRDATPVQYWITMGLRITALVACLFVAIFGWLQPNA